MDLSDDDIDLEAELAAISGGASARDRQKKKVQEVVNLDAMITASLKDVPSDDDVESGKVKLYIISQKIFLNKFIKTKFVNTLQ